MKILKLKIQNINSIYGCWTIDFQKPEYTEYGLFLLSGKTGSGKTTLFDAVCLALFGKTPRLDKKAKGEKNTPVEVMSIGTGESAVDLLFEAQGTRYRASWGLNRARNKPDGNIQDVKRELVDETNDRLLESKNKLINEAIEKVIGMNFDQFTKTMMLAQGDFSTFLKAKGSERAQLFEKIVGGEIYRQISVSVYDRMDKEHQNLKTVQEEKEKKETTLLNDEQIQLLEKEQSQLTEEKTLLEGTQKKIHAEREWLNRVNDLKAQAEQYRSEEVSAQEQWNQAAPKREQRIRAQKAEKLNGLYDDYVTRRGELNSIRIELKEAQELLPKQEEKGRKSQADFTAAEGNLEAVRNEEKNQQPVWKQVSALDIQIQEKRKSYDAEQNQLDTLRRDAADLKRQLQTQKDSLNTVEKDILAHQEYQQNHPEEKRLVSEFSGMKVILEQIQKEKDALSEQENEQNKALDAWNSVQEALKTDTEDVNTKENVFRQKEERLKKLESGQAEILDGHTLDDYKEKRDQLQKIDRLNRVIQSLTEHRAKLADNQPCPLCGSVHHPYAEGNIPSATEDEKKLEEVQKLIRLIEKGEKNLTTAKTQKDQAQTELLKSRHRQELTQNRADQAWKKYEQAAETLKEQNQRYQDKCRTIDQMLLLYGMSLANDSADSIFRRLTARRDAWTERENLLNTQTAEKQQFQTRISSQQSVILELEKQIKEKELKQEQQAEILDVLKKQRFDLFGDKNPLSEEKKLSRAVQTAESALEEARQQKDDDQKAVDTAKQDIESFRKQENSIIPKFAEAEQKLTEQMTAAGFTGIDDFTQSRMESGPFRQLEEELEEQDAKLQKAKTRSAQKQEEYQQEQAKNLTEKTIDEVENKIQEVNRRKDEIISRDTEIRGQIKWNKENIQELAEINTKYRKQEKTYQNWKRLSDLIGSKNGNKYPAFVQNLTFTHIAALANQHLHRITDRYELIPSSTEELGLLVCDHYMADEYRSVRNISGGEQFMVSLALALGISQMASRNVRVDSLFLDEGFGTLDKGMLHKAVEALVSLRQSSGKMIGIISHVEELKEYITTQIEIESNRNGRSTLHGPGINRK